jgi:hypothetical protein
MVLLIESIPDIQQLPQTHFPAAFAWTTCYIAVHVFLLAFRGTSSVEDVLTDADVVGSLTPSRSALIKGSVKGLKVHDGFEDAYISAREEILDCLDRYMKSYGTETKPTVSILIVLLIHVLLLVWYVL